MKNCTRHGTSFEDGAYCPGCVAALALAETDEGDAVPLGTLGNYELLSEIGRGGMGVVYLARQPALNRLVALKLLPSGSLAGREFVGRFRRECELAASLGHPNIVRIHEAGEADGELFYSMEWVPGGSLADWRDGKTQPPAVTARMLHTLAGAVDFAHAKGVLHRDLKPSNVLIDEDGNPKVADFGLAKALGTEDDLTLLTHSFGSPAYMAPELIRDPKAAAPASDIYSLAAILYFLLTGRSPFVSASLDRLLQQVRETEPAAPRLLNPAVPKDLEKICLKGLDKQPARRYPTAGAFAEDLGRFIEGRPVKARPAGMIRKLARASARSPWLTALAVCLALAIIGGLAGIMRQSALANRRSTQLARSLKTLRANLYASDMANGFTALERGDASLAGEILARWDMPPPGDEDLRGFEWHLLKQEGKAAPHRLLEKRQATITSLARTDDGQIVVADQAGAVSMFAPDGTRTADHPEWAAEQLVAIPPDIGGGWAVVDREEIRWLDKEGHTSDRMPGRQIAVASRVPLALVGSGPRFHWAGRGGDFTLLDWKTHAKVRDFPGDWRHAAISADGRLVALAAVEGGVKLVDLVAGTTRDLPTDAPVWGLSFDEAGKRLAAGSRRFAMVWELGGAGAVVVIPHDLTVWMTAFSPDGGKFLTTSSDRRVRVWDSKHLQDAPQVLGGSPGEVWCGIFDSSGKQVFAGGKGGELLAWPLATAPSSPPLLIHDENSPPFFSPDGTFLFTRQGGRSIRHSTTDDRTTELPPGVLALGMAAGGNQLIAMDGHARIGCAPLDNPAAIIFRGEENPSSAGLRYLRVCGNGRWVARVLKDGTVLLENPLDGRVVHRFTSHASGMRHAVAASGDGRFLAICGDGEPGVILHDLVNGAERRLLPDSSYYYVSLAFSADGRLLAAGDLSGAIQIWQTGSERASATLPGHPEETSALAFSPDGRTLASMGFHQDLKLWNVSTWREMRSVNLPDAAFGLVFSPDGRHLVCSLGATKNERLRWFPKPESGAD